MKKVLIISTVSRQFYLFEKNNIKMLNQLGYEVHGAANYADRNPRLNGLEMIHHHFDIQRSPLSFRNFRALRQLISIIRENNIDIIHCHSPMGGFLGRIASLASNVESVIYTAHGFHFYEGAPLINWMVYYPVERFLSRYTDLLITINKEDYNRAKNFNSKKLEYVPGIGVDSEKLKNVKIDEVEKRKSIGVEKNDFMIISVGELNKNKNHRIIIKAISKIKNKKIKYVLCGQGTLEKELKSLVQELGLENQVKFLGFRDDIPELISIADLFAFPSFREGLSVSLMEAMSVGLPVVCSDIRGNSDLIDHTKGGYLVNKKNIDEYSKRINELYQEKSLRDSFGKYNQEKIKDYSTENVLESMYNIYSVY